MKYIKLMAKIKIDENFRNHLLSSYPLEEEVLNHLLDDLGDYFSDDLPSFISRRHQQMQKEGLKNTEIYKRIQSDLTERRFSAKPLSIRQIRRIIYG
ncbi:hypothetical protein [Oceanispirochaeta sp. M1]|uniref:hypothetical protein n=2 Tax=Oceanispirochaeta TaxID=2035349 RepID=UPI000E093EB8|nr:hypothetical protein [Oceanispirochaeta sp. M1]RDG34386.1 hypothetical protein DV872_00795 [Oceanispirochaeta sp. M1]